MKKIVILAMGMVMSMTTLAQNNIETTISADFVNEYIWRGLKLGDISVQPKLGVGYKGLSLTAWGNYGLSNVDDSKEFDLTLDYTIKGFSIGITDYWFSKGQDPDSRYFKYDAHGTNHVFEAYAGYDFSFASVKWFTNFAGNDYNMNGKRDYSCYAEVNVPFRLAAVDWTGSAGVVPFKSSMYRTNGFAVTYLSLRANKEIRITDTFTVPIFGQVAADPCTQNAYLVVGLTLRP
jgi:hypothetical protein